MTDRIDRWYPVMRAEEAERRHVARSQLLGQELAIWRDDDGQINAWANRCPHRGVRLSIGANLGRSLQCRYHGWIFESGTAQCIAIPAHPELKPAKAFKAQPFGAIERHGYVWVHLGNAAETPALPVRTGETVLTLRSLPVRASASLMAEGLLSLPGLSLQALDAFTFDGRMQDSDAVSRILILLQPMSEDLTQLHAALIDPSVNLDRIGWLRHGDYVLTEARAILEQAAAATLVTA